MSDVRYVVRMFDQDQYLYSVHCDHAILDELIKNAKDNGYSVKIVAYNGSEDKE